MSTLEQTAVVQVPFAQAADFVEEFFGAQKDGADYHLQLVVPGATIGVPGMTMEKDVRLRLLRERGPNQTIVFALHWAPENGGPYPEFDGSLVVEQDETYETCRLRLRGTYEPPLGIAGKVFDVAIGSRIAGATAHKLLERIDGFLTRGYLEREHEKRLQLLLRGA